MIHEDDSFEAKQRRREEFASQLAGVSQETGEQSFFEFGNNVLEGAANTISMVPEFGGIVAEGLGKKAQSLAQQYDALKLLDPAGKMVEESGRITREFSETIRDATEELTQEAEGMSPGGFREFFTRDVAQGVGSTLPFFGIGMMARAAGVPAVQLLNGKLQLDVATALTGAAVGGAGEFLEQEARNPDDELKQWQALAAGFGVGAGEALPIGGMLNRINQRSGGQLKRIMVDKLIDGGEEFVQEMTQTLSSNAIAKFIGEEDVELTQGILRAGAAGGLSAILLGMAAQGSADLSRGEGFTKELQAIADEQAELEGQVEQYADENLSQDPRSVDSAPVGSLPQLRETGGELDQLAAEGQQDVPPVEMASGIPNPFRSSEDIQRVRAEQDAQASDARSQQEALDMHPTWDAGSGIPQIVVPAPKSGEVWFHGGEDAGSLDSSRPLFATRQREGAEWYSDNRGGGEVAEVSMEDIRPARLRDIISAAEAVGATEEDIRANSPYEGDNELDFIYVPEVAEELRRRGFNAGLTSDSLSNDEIDALALLPGWSMDGGTVRGETASATPPEPNISDGTELLGPDPDPLDRLYQAGLLETPEAATVEPETEASATVEGQEQTEDPVAVSEPSQPAGAGLDGDSVPANPALRGFHGSPQTDLDVVLSSPESRQFPNATSELGAFFSPDEAGASRYAGEGGRIYGADLPISNPYEMSGREFLALQKIDKSADGENLLAQGVEAMEARNQELIQEARSLRAELEQKGHDGIIVRDSKGNIIEMASFADVPLVPTAKAPTRPVQPEYEQAIDGETLEDLAEGKDLPPEKQQLASGLLPFLKSPSVQKVKAWMKRNLTTKGDLTKEVFDEKVKRDGWVSAQAEEMKLTVRDFDKAVKRVFGNNASSQRVHRLIDDAFKDPAKMSAIKDQQLRGLIQRMRDHVDALSQRMIDEGVVEGDLAIRIAENMGFYATRTYRIHQDPDWAQKIPADVRNRAKSWLRAELAREGEILTDEQLEGRINEIIADQQAAHNPFAALADAPIGRKDLSILKKRKDIPEPLRELFGENRSAVVNYANSVGKMANLLANNRFLKDVRAAGLEGGWFLDESTGPVGDIAHKVATETSPSLAPLGGLYMEKDLARAFEEHFATERVWSLLKPYLAFNGAVKLGKTVGSPMTHVRNYFGNFGFALAQGHLNLAKTGKATSDAARRVSQKASSNEEWRAYYLRAVELGIAADGAASGAVRDIVDDVWSKQEIDPVDAQRNIMRRAAKGTVETAAQVYQLSDDAWKLAAWEHEKARHKKAMPNATEAEIEQIAADKVLKTYPTYSRIPKAVRALRRFPVVGTFVSFPSEVIRVGGNTVALIKEEIGSDNAGIRKIGYQRLTGTLAAATLPTVLTMWARALIGMDWEEENNAREFLPPWSKNSNILWLGYDEDGNPEYIDLSYADPWSYLKDPIQALFRGQDTDDAIMDAAWQAASPWLSEEIMTQAILDWSRNKTTTGQRVYDEAASWDVKAGETLAHFWKAAEPGFISQAKRIEKGWNNEVSKYGRQYDARTEIMAVVTGMRRSKLDVAQSLGFKGGEYSRAKSESTRTISQLLSSESTLEDQEIIEVYERAERQRKDAWRRMYRAYQASLSLGMNPEDALAKMSTSISKKDARHIASGEYHPYVPSGGFLRSSISRSSRERAEELSRRVDILREYAQGQEMAVLPDEDQ